MSLPDYILLRQTNAPPRFDGFPHRLVLRPAGGATPGRQGAVFLIEHGCAPETLRDAALDEYLKTGIAVFFCARRARDLRPFLRRAESFLRRGYAVEVLA